MNIKEILDKYPNLPHKFLVKFALYCANDVKHLLKNERSIKALESVQLWLEDKISQADIRKIADEAYNAISFVSESSFYYAAYYVASYASIDDVSGIDGTIYSAEAVVYWTCQALEVSADKYRNKLLKMIDELDDMEKLLYL